MTSLAVCQSLINYYLAAAGRLFAVFAFGGWRATFSRFRLAVSVGAVRAVLFFRRFGVFFCVVCGGRVIFCRLRWLFGRAFYTFCGVYVLRRAGVLCFLRCLSLAAGGRCGWFSFFASFAVLNLFAVGGRFFVFLRCFFLAAGGRFSGVFGWRLAGVRCGRFYCFAAFLSFFYLRFAAGVCLFFATFALAFRACVLRCLRFAAGGRFSQFKVQTFGPQRSSKSAALECNLVKN